MSQLPRIFHSIQELAPPPFSNHYGILPRCLQSLPLPREGRFRGRRGPLSPLEANVELLTLLENVDHIPRDSANRQIPTDYLKVISRSFEKKEDGDGVAITLDDSIERRKVTDRALGLRTMCNTF